MNTNISSKGKLLLAFAGAGIVFSLLATYTTLAISSIGLEFGNSVGGIVSTMFSGNPQAMGLMVLTTIIFGLYIWIFGFIASKVKAKINHEKNAKLSARPHLIGLLVLGAIGVGIFGIVDDAIAGAGTSTNPEDFIANATGLNIIGLVYQIVAYAILGMVAIWLGTKFTAIEDKFPDVVKKV